MRGPQKPSWTILALGRFIAAGGTALAASFALGSLGAAGIVNMATAYGLLVLATGVGAFAWVLSPFVWSRQPRTKIAIGFLGAFGLLALSLSLGRYEYWQSYELTHLFPGSSPSPPTSCYIPPGSSAVYLGSNVTVVNAFPHTVIVLGNGNSGPPYPMLTVDSVDGALSLETLRLFDANGNIITRFDENAIWSNSNLRTKRPDVHTFVVYDNNDLEALRVVFVNPSAIKITGSFHVRGRPMLTITDHALTYGGSIISNFCNHASRYDFIL